MLKINQPDQTIPQPTYYFVVSMGRCHPSRPKKFRMESRRLKSYFEAVDFMEDWQAIERDKKPKSRWREWAVIGSFDPDGGIFI